MPWIPVDHTAINLGAKEHHDVQKIKSTNTTSEPKRGEFQQYLKNGLTSAAAKNIDTKNVKLSKKIYTAPSSKKAVLSDLQHGQQHVTTSVKNHRRIHHSEQTVPQPDISAQGIAGAFAVEQNHISANPVTNHHMQTNVGHLRTKKVSETVAATVPDNAAGQLHQIKNRVHQLISEQGQSHRVGAKNMTTHGLQNKLPGYDQVQQGSPNMKVKTSANAEAKAGTEAKITTVNTVAQRLNQSSVQQNKLPGYDQVQQGSPNMKVKTSANVEVKVGTEARVATVNTGAQWLNSSSVHETQHGTLQGVPVQSAPQSANATKVSIPPSKQEAVVAVTLPSQANLSSVLGLQAKNQMIKVVPPTLKENNTRNQLNHSLALLSNNNSLKISREGVGQSLKLKGKNRPITSPTIQTTSLSPSSMTQLLTRYFENVNSGNPQPSNGQPSNSGSGGQNSSTVTQNNLPWNFINSQSLGTEVSKWLSGQAYKLSFVGASSVILTLIPENLGKVRLSVKNDKNGQLEVRIAASNKEALGLLTDNVASLQQQLVAGGYESVTINLGMDQQTSQDGSGVTPDDGMFTPSRVNNATTANVHREQLGNQYLLQDLHQGFIAEA